MSTRFKRFLVFLHTRLEAPVYALMTRVFLKVFSEKRRVLYQVISSGATDRAEGTFS